MPNPDLSSVPGAPTLVGSWAPILMTDPVGHVWHYTDAAALVSIIKHGELWASAATTMNDPTELSFGAALVSRWYARNADSLSGDPRILEFLTEAVAELESAVIENPAFIVSASEDPRLLHQWRNYAGTGGYALNLESFETAFAVKHGPSLDAEFTLQPVWVRVLYEEALQAKRIESALAYITNEATLIGRLVATDGMEDAAVLIRANLAALAATMKDDAFAAEKEVRLVAYLPKAVTASHRATLRGVVPYVELHAIRTVPFSDHPPKVSLPIQEVRVGPPTGQSEDQRKAGVRSLLKAAGLGGIPVSGAGIPYLP